MSLVSDRRMLGRGWSEKVFYGGLCGFSLIALATELREPNSPYFWMVWAALVPIMAYGFIRSWRIPLLQIDDSHLTFWRSPFTGPIRMQLDAIRTVYVDRGRRKITLEFIRGDGDPVQFVPPFQSGATQRQIVGILQDYLPGRVEVDPLHSRK